MHIKADNVTKVTYVNNPSLKLSFETYFDTKLDDTHIVTYGMYHSG